MQAPSSSVKSMNRLGILFGLATLLATFAAGDSFAAVPASMEQGLKDLKQHDTARAQKTAEERRERERIRALEDAVKKAAVAEAASSPKKAEAPESAASAPAPIDQATALQYQMFLKELEAERRVLSNEEYEAIRSLSLSEYQRTNAATMGKVGAMVPLSVILARASLEARRNMSGVVTWENPVPTHEWSRMAMTGATPLGVGDRIVINLPISNWNQFNENQKQAYASLVREHLRSERQTVIQLLQTIEAEQKTLLQQLAQNNADKIGRLQPGTSTDLRAAGFKQAEYIRSRTAELVVQKAQAMAYLKSDLSIEAIREMTVVKIGQRQHPVTGKVVIEIPVVQLYGKSAKGRAPDVARGLFSKIAETMPEQVVSITKFPVSKFFTASKTLIKGAGKGIAISAAVGGLLWLEERSIGLVSRALLSYSGLKVPDFKKLCENRNVPEVKSLLGPEIAECDLLDTPKGAATTENDDSQLTTPQFSGRRAPVSEVQR